VKTPQIEGTATRRRRGIILVALGVVATGLSVGGVGAVLARGPSSPQTRPESVSPAAPPSVARPAVTAPSPSVAPVQPAPSAEPTPDPTALADGVYPTFVRAVDVHGGTVTVDVLQVFVGAEQHQAAIEDGVPWGDVRYDPVYIRNENPLLRTLPVSRDARIRFMGTCEAASRQDGLTQLRRETTPFHETFYYAMSVRDGGVVAIEQKIAISAC
jgi:pyruvate/2-oxoglutarate dehydrogenase complex dihydrolipoamide acyltransferase (E2) component